MATSAKSPGCENDQMSNMTDEAGLSAEVERLLEAPPSDAAVTRLLEILRSARRAGAPELEAEVTIALQELLVSGHHAASQSDLIASQTHLSRFVELLLGGIELDPRQATRLLVAAAHVESELSGNDPVQGLRRAMRALEEAVLRLEAWPEGGDERDYYLAFAQSTLGLTIQRLSLLDETVDLTSSLALFREALAYRTVDERPVDWAYTSLCLAVALEQQGTLDDLLEAADLAGRCATILLAHDDPRAAAHADHNRSCYLLSAWLSENPAGPVDGSTPQPELLHKADAAATRSVDAFIELGDDQSAAASLAQRVGVRLNSGMSVIDDALQSMKLVAPAECAPTIERAAIEAANEATSSGRWRVAAMALEYAALARRADSARRLRSSDRTAALPPGNTRARWAAHMWVLAGEPDRGLCLLESSSCRELKHITLRPHVESFISEVEIKEADAGTALRAAERAHLDSIHRRLSGASEPTVDLGTPTWQSVCHKVSVLLDVEPPFDQPDIEAVTRKLDIGEVALVVNPTPTGTSVIVLTPAGDIHTRVVPGLTSAELADWAFGSGTGDQVPYVAFLNGHGELADHLEELRVLLSSSIDALSSVIEARSTAAIVVHAPGPYSAVPWQLAADSSGRSLIDHVCLTRAPSLEIFSACRERSNDRSFSSILIVADPEPHRSPLPGTAIEAVELERLSEHLRTTLCVQRDAAKQRFVEEFGAHDIVHVAAHGSAGSGPDSQESFLSLAHDERLTWEDVAGLATDRSPLVVLSSCLTALSTDYSTSSEQFGLPYAFLAAGASAVIAAQWPVDDDATSLLMAQFYYQLLHLGEAPDASLRNAQLWLRGARSNDIKRLTRRSTLIGAAERRQLDSSAPPYADEGFWAGFVLIGG